MSPDRFRACLASLRWSQRGLAEALGCNPRTVRCWVSGDTPVPGTVVAWLEKVEAVLRDHPPPRPRNGGS